MDKIDKVILAVPSDKVASITSQALQNDGFRAFKNEEEYKNILSAGLMKRRGDLETDESNKQIIPYMVIANADKVFYYVRPAGVSEGRLQNKLSIGVGGHIEIEDIDQADSAIDIALRREVKEELGEDADITDIRPLGFIYTDKSEVDRVHLGILFVGNLVDQNLNISAEEMGQNGFVSREEFTNMLRSNDYFPENWTQIAWQMAGKMILQE